MNIKTGVLVAALFFGTGHMAYAQADADNTSAVALDEEQAAVIDNAFAQFSPEDISVLKEMIDGYQQDAQQTGNSDVVMQNLVHQLEDFFANHVKLEEQKVQAFSGVKTAAMIAAVAFAAWVAMRIVDFAWCAKIAWNGERRRDALAARVAEGVRPDAPAVAAIPAH